MLLTPAQSLISQVVTRHLLKDLDDEGDFDEDILRTEKGVEPMTHNEEVIDQEVAQEEELPPAREYIGYKHCCVIDENNLYVTLVLCFIYRSGEEETLEPQYYTLPEGSRIVQANAPSQRPHAGAEGLIIPKWDDEFENWIEGATEEEISAWEIEHPAPEVPDPNESLESRVDALEAAQANIWSEQASAIKEGINSVE